MTYRASGISGCFVILLEGKVILNEPSESVNFATLSEVAKPGAILFKQYFDICYFSVVYSICSCSSATSSCEVLINCWVVSGWKQTVVYITSNTSKPIKVKDHKLKMFATASALLSPEIYLNFTFSTQQAGAEGDGGVIMTPLQRSSCSTTYRNFTLFTQDHYL